MIQKQITLDDLDVQRIEKWQALMNLDSFSATVRKIVRDFLDGHNAELVKEDA